MTNRKNYPKYLISYTVAGTGFLTYKNTTHKLNAGDLFIINCMDYHCYHSDPEDSWQFKWIHFSGGNTSWYYNTYVNQLGNVVHLDKSTSILTHIETFFQLMHYELSPTKDMILNQYLIHIFTHLLTAPTASLSSDSFANDTRIANAVQYIKDHYHDSITVEILAKTCNLSRYHFSRVFKSIMHTSPHEYVIRYRITMAKHLLVTTTKSIEFIAFETGFTDSSHFIKTFKLYEYMTPFAYKGIYTNV